MQNRKMTKTTHGVFMLPKTWIGKCVLPTVLMDKCRGSAMISRWGQHTRCCSRPSCTHSVKLLLNFILFYFLKKLMPSIINLSGPHSGSHTILVVQKLVTLKWSYNCVITQFITHNLIHTTSQYTCISPFITGSNCHLLTIWITIS